MLWSASYEYRDGHTHFHVLYLNLHMKFLCFNEICSWNLHWKLSYDIFSFVLDPYLTRSSTQTCISFVTMTHSIENWFIIECRFHYDLLCYLRHVIQGGSNMTGTNCDLFTHNQSRSYLNHLVFNKVKGKLIYDSMYCHMCSLIRFATTEIMSAIYKVVQIWPGQTVTYLHTNSPGHIWTTLYMPTH
jgi:hypothetical protein